MRAMIIPFDRPMESCWRSCSNWLMNQEGIRDEGLWTRAAPHPALPGGGLGGDDPLSLVPRPSSLRRRVEVFDELPLPVLDGEAGHRLERGVAVGVEGPLPQRPVEVLRLADRLEDRRPVLLRGA